MTFTASEILYSTLIGGSMIIGLIFAFRKYLAHQSNQLASKYESQELSPTLKKYPEANVFKFGTTFYRVGLMFSIGIAILAFNWTTFEKYVPMDELFIYTDIEMATPIVPNEPPPLPPPPPVPVIEELPDDLIDESIEFIHDSFEDTSLDIIPFEEKSKNSKPPVIIDEPDEEIIEDAEFVVVEDMPSFPGCEDLSTNEERKACTEKSLMSYIYNSIRYPSVARDNGIEGLVVVSFVINKEGKIEKANVLKDIGGGCGDEALRVINTMNDMPQDWTPGRQRSQNVNVRFNMPVRFRLQK